MTKALFFDVFGTVVNWRDSIARELRRFGAAQGLERDWFAMADRWRALYQPSMEPVRRGERGYVKLDILHGENLDRVLTEFELEAVGPEDRAYLTTAWHRLVPWADVVPGLNRMKPRFILAPVSNGNISLMVNLARFAALPWDTVLGSEVARDYKPMPAVYLKSAEALSLPPADCMMVAAHNSDLAAARALGLGTAFVARLDEYGPHQTQDFKAEEDWDFIAEDFVELAEKLVC
jgi:2-haloacid dehalogenase